MPTAETEKFIRTLETLAEYAPDKSLPEQIAKAKELMGLTSRRPRERKAKPKTEAVA